MESTESKRLLVTGSRDFTDVDLATSALSWAWRMLGGGDIVLVHGAARGLDTVAATIWSNHGLRCEPHPADWKSFGKSAGHRRNAEMVSLGADLCLAFPVGESRGTRGCMALAAKAGIEVVNATEGPVPNT